MRGIVTEAAAHRLLAEAGLPYVATAVFECPDNVTADQLPSADRYVVKVDSATELHRASAGLIRLGVSADQLKSSADDLWHASELIDDKRLVVQPQLTAVAELSVGVVRDDLYGLVLIVGPGGALAEDQGAWRQALLLPAGKSAIENFCVATCRQVPSLATEALQTVVEAVQLTASRQARLTSMDVNPILVFRDGSVSAVDSLLICS
jgi:succinyl-CoA synthetase beta subunit